MGDVGNADLVNGGVHNSTIDPAVAVFVSEFLQYKLSQNGYQWRSPVLSTRDLVNGSSISAKASLAMRALAEDFIAQFKDHFVEMCTKLDVNEETVKSSIEGVANELFSEGIKWARIVAFFVFNSELAVHCKNRNWTDLINVIAYAQSEYISEKLLPWIKDHGDWEGLIQFQDDEDDDDDEDSAGNKWPPALKNFLCLGLSALGALTLGAVFTKS